MKNRRLWAVLIATVAASFLVLGLVGSEIYRTAPPIPAQVVTSDGTVVYTAQDIETGQNVWQSMGGQESGTVWGHGAYVAPDWSADWLHREATALLDIWANRSYARPYAALDEISQAGLRAKLRQELRTNSFDAAGNRLVISTDRLAAIRSVAAHYESLFAGSADTDSLRRAYALRQVPVPDAHRRAELNAFFFWTAWACVTNRPGATITYTNNWPAEPLVGNTPTRDAFLWTFISIVVLIAGIGALVWQTALRQQHDVPVTPPSRDPLLGLKATPSMRATSKYFWTVIGLVLAQIALGVVTAHYGVEGQSLYGFPLAKYLPYTVTRTWHTQLGIFWIATAWLATGLYIAPVVSGYEPKWQKLGVNFLWICLVVIVVGSMIGQWFSVMQNMGLTTSFWFGHQGYEYVDLGRFWQIFLFVGLFVWLGLMVRALLPAIKQPSENRQLLVMFTISATAIAAFYGAGLMWGQHTHLAVAEYWRWWVVHLWVEGFFEVFATVVIAFLFVRLGLIESESATRAALFSTIVFLFGGVLGTFHHLYFSGTPTSVLALGASFSALEVVPLVLVGFEALHNYRISRAQPWLRAYRWPIYFFLAVSFWNLLGAGVFGFLINPPLALYYMQGLNTTPVHGHTALFGVYGMLGIGLMLFCLRGLAPRRHWDERLLKFAFWALNIGLLLMVVLSLLPIGLLQTSASISHGLWYARSAEFLGTPMMTTLKWMRVPGDVVFSAGIAALALFVVKLGRRDTSTATVAQTKVTEAAAMAGVALRVQE